MMGLHLLYQVPSVLVRLLTVSLLGQDRTQIPTTLLPTTFLPSHGQDLVVLLLATMRQALLAEAV